MNLQKITTITVLALSLVLSSASIAKAQTDDSVSPADIRARIEDRKNQDKATLEDRTREAKRDVRPDARVINADAREAKRVAVASTSMFKRDAKVAAKDIKKRMDLRQFEIRKNALVKTLNNAIQNLIRIADRIEARMATAEESGRDMSEPKVLLVTAKQKIDAAKADVLALQNLVISTSTPTTNSTTTEVDLLKPRQVGDAAIKSVKAARDALKEVVVSIAKNMGLGNRTATSTPSGDTSTTTLSN